MPALVRPGPVADAPHTPDLHNREPTQVANRRTPVLEDVADTDLLAEYHDSGDLAALEQLIDRYRRFARAKARGYFLIGGDADDVEQEALIGLYKLSLIHI